MRPSARNGCNDLLLAVLGDLVSSGKAVSAEVCGGPGDGGVQGVFREREVTPPRLLRWIVGRLLDTY